MRRLRRFSLLVLSSVLISALLVTSLPILGASIDPGGSGSATSVVYADGGGGDLTGTVVIHSAGAGTVSGVYYGELTKFTTLHVTSINSDIVLQTHHQILWENWDEFGQVVETGFKFQSGFGSPAIPPGRWRVCVRQGGSYNPCSRVFTVGSDGTVVPDEPVVDEPPPKPALSARFIVSPAVPMVGEPIIFTSVSECYGGAEIKGYNWTLNGQSIANIDPSYVDKVSWVWPAPTEGACTVTLFIYTDSGLKDQCTQKFWVNAVTARFEIDQKSLNVSGQEITFTSTSSPEESITEYHWRIDGNPDVYPRAEDKKSWTYRFEPGTHKVSLCVVGASGQDTYTKEFTVAPVHLLIDIAGVLPPIRITDQPQHMLIKLVVRQIGEGGLLVPYEGAMVGYTVDVKPAKYQGFCTSYIVPWPQIRSTDASGVAEYECDITGLLLSASVDGIDPQTFAAEIEIKASARPRTGASEDWHLEATETIHVGGARPVEVLVQLMKDDENIQTRFNDYQDNVACLCKECRTSGHSEPGYYDQYEVHLTGTVTNGYLPISMTLQMGDRGSWLAVDGKEKKKVTLGQLPFNSSYDFSIWQRVTLGQKRVLKILLIQDMATEVVLQGLRMVFQAVGGEKFATAATLGTLFYDIVNKVRANAATGKQQVSEWDYLGLALAEIGERQGEIAKKLGKAGKNFAAIPFTAVGMVYDSGVWALSLYNTPGVAEEIWWVELREAKP